jgi:hypothetical protein
MPRDPHLPIRGGINFCNFKFVSLALPVSHIALVRGVCQVFVVTGRVTGSVLIWGVNLGRGLDHQVRP